MEELELYIQNMLNEEMIKFVISKPKLKKEEIKKIVVEKKQNYYQISKYSDKQVFHENVKEVFILEKLKSIIQNNYLQVNAFKMNTELILLISKDGKCHFKRKKSDINLGMQNEHNRQKNYILKEGKIIEPLIEMGIFTHDGKIINAMYDKYKQINRFLEIIDDVIKEENYKELNIIDFGCGKSYLTFVVYYYLKEIKGIKGNIIGLDLKEDVIKKCNAIAKKYNYESLRFEVGDINNYNAPFKVDMVLTLHACDIATDYALYNAIKWQEKMIFSVPCCQHELNNQCQPTNLKILSEYGIIKERMCALFTDAIRANLLEYEGYKTQLLEFVDFEHTPKNILIRAVKKQLVSKNYRLLKLEEIHKLMKEFNFLPTLYKLLINNKEDQDLEKISFK